MIIITHFAAFIVTFQSNSARNRLCLRALRGKTIGLHNSELWEIRRTSQKNDQKLLSFWTSTLCRKWDFVRRQRSDRITRKLGAMRFCHVGNYRGAGHEFWWLPPNNFRLTKFCSGLHITRGLMREKCSCARYDWCLRESWINWRNANCCRWTERSI